MIRSAPLERLKPADRRKRHVSRNYRLAHHRRSCGLARGADRQGRRIWAHRRYHRRHRGRGDRGLAGRAARHPDRRWIRKLDHRRRGWRRDPAVRAPDPEARLKRGPPRSVIARDGTVVRGHPIAEIEDGLVDIAPAPALRRVIALDDGVTGRLEMLGRVAVRGVVAAADMAAGTAEPEMHPDRAQLEAFLAAERAGRDIVDLVHVRADIGHQVLLGWKGTAG